MGDANVNGVAPGSIPADTKAIANDAAGGPGIVIEHQDFTLPELLDTSTDVVIEFPHVPVITTTREGRDRIQQPAPVNVDRVNITYEHNDMESTATEDSFKTAEDLSPVITVVPAERGK